MSEQQVIDSAAPQATTAPEAAAPATQPEVKDDFAKRIALLSKKEANALKTKTEVEQMRKAFEEERSRFTKEREGISNQQSTMEKIKAKDWKALDELGFDLQDYVNYKTGGEKPTVETLLERQKAEMQAEFKKYLQEYDGSLRKEFGSAAEEANQKIITAQKYEVKQAVDNGVDSKGEKFEFIYDVPDYEQEVLNVIEENFRSKGVRLKPLEAAQMIEDYLYEDQIKAFEKKTKLKKIAEERFKPKEQDPGQKSSKPTTLNNSMTQASPPKDKQKYSIEESLNNAKTLLKWT